MKKILNQVSRYVGIISVSLFLLLLGISMVYAEPSADQLAKQAKEMRLKAAQARCKQIGDQMNRCMSGDKQTCKERDSASGSIALFTKDFGYTPEMACPPDPDFLFKGDVR